MTLPLKDLFKNSAQHGQSELSRIDYLDGWRGLAISFVLFAHFIPNSFYSANYGRLGVDIFFVLSGMFMSKILFEKRVPLATFYKRRFSRILPVFVIFISVFYFASYVFSLSNEHENFFYTLFFLRTYFPSDPSIIHSGIPIGHLWSLNVEEHCYILLSIITLFKIFKGREYLPLLIIGFTTVSLKYIYEIYPETASANYDIKTEIVASHLFLSAGYYLIRDRFTKFVPPWLPMLTFVLAVLCYFEGAPWYATWLFSPLLLAFTVNHLHNIPEFFKNMLRFKPLSLLGVWSYSIYLWQQPFYYYGVKFGELFPFAGIVFFLPLAIATGMFSFYFIENPIRTYLNNRF